MQYAFTGHRPKDLPPGYMRQDLDRALDEWLEHEPHADGFITGGALGIDTMAATYALNHGIELTLILPFPVNTMTRFWHPNDRDILDHHWDQADFRQIIDPSGNYNPAAYQTRNIAMIDRCDKLLAFWSGKRYGGTWNAIQYAQSIGKPMTNLL